MPANITRVGAGFALAVLCLLGAASVTAAAEPSPGVPCLDMVQQLAASPPSVPEVLETAAIALNGIAPDDAPMTPPVPAAEVVHGLTASAAPGPVPAPVEEAAVPAVPVVAPPIPAAVPAVPVVVAPAPPTAPLIQAAAAVPEPPVAAPAPAPVAEVPAPAPPVSDVVASEVISASAVPPLTDVPTDVPADIGISSVDAAPIAHAAAVPAPLPGPAAPVVPVPAAPVAPTVPIPVVPLPDAVPSLPLLPAGLPVPQDLVCEGTAW